MKNVNVAILGATGAVGLEFLQILEQRSFPLGELRLLASPRSAGKSMPFRGRDLPVHAVSADSFRDIHIALFSAGASISREWAPIAVKAGARVVDNSSAFRMDANVPLVVPEINPQTIGDCPVNFAPWLNTESLNGDVVLWYRSGWLHPSGDLNDFEMVGPTLYPVGDWSP